MNKTAIKNFAVEARVMLINAVTQLAYEFEVTENGTNDPAQESVNGRSLTAAEKNQRSQLIANIRQNGFTQTMEEAAYTWFNRFIALRFMEVNNYLPSHTRIFSDESGNFKPEVLSDAANVEIDGLDKELILELLENQENERLYKYIIITQCNALNKGLPEMFEQIGGWTELLFPRNLLREDSVIAKMITEIPEEDWRDQVQIIGWLYQYYITELNELVYDGRMSKDKIPKHLISAATTIYTPDWSVRYMVENSLGRLWTEGHGKPENADWKYYLDEAEQEDPVKAELEKIRAEYKNIQPENIKIIDPCMGSGHILVYAFDVLIDIYRSCGWGERDAAKSILRNNLYGLDIDRRAYQLAYFAVMMKARQYNRRICSPENQPNLANFADVMGADTDMLSGSIRRFAEQFAFADTYGSLMTVTAPADIDTAFSDFMPTLGLTLRQLDMMMKIYNILGQKYDVVCTNPPYLGSSRFAPTLADYVNANFPSEKSDLSMAMFRHCVDHLAANNGFVAFITTSSWFFLSSFEKLRKYILSGYQMDSIVDYGTELFDGKVGHNPIVSWVLRNHKPCKPITAIRLVDYCYARRDEKEPEFFNERNRHTAKQENFSKIPGSPVAYWVSEAFVKTFEDGIKLNEIAPARKGMFTGNNNLWLKMWYEISYTKFLYQFKPYNKGGEYRKWYGNHEYVVNWGENGLDIKSFKGSGNINDSMYFRKCITWSLVTSAKQSFRAIIDNDHVLGDAGPVSLTNDENMYYILGVLNSCYMEMVISILAPTLNCSNGVVGGFPILLQQEKKDQVDNIVKKNIEISKQDWDSFETSWDFEKHPLI